MNIHIVKGVGGYEGENLKAFESKQDAVEWMDNYDGDDDFAFLCIETMTVQESTHDD